MRAAGSSSGRRTARGTLELSPPRSTSGRRREHRARSSAGSETSTIGASAHAVRSVNGSPWRACARRSSAVGRAIHSTVCSAAGSRGPGGRPCMSEGYGVGSAHMIEPYQAIGLIPTMRGIRRRDEIEKQPRAHRAPDQGGLLASSLDLPVRLIAIPEGALQGFTDEVFDLDHVTYARECAIDIPGPETDFLGELARQWNVLHHGARRRRATRSSRIASSTSASSIDPRARSILQHHKLVDAVPRRALGDPARRLGPLDRAVRRDAGRVLSRSSTPRSAGSA